MSFSISGKGLGIGNFGVSNNIDTNSNQYKAAMKKLSAAWAVSSPVNMTEYEKQMTIKNWMKSYDKDGDYIDPVTGIAGLDGTGKSISERHQIIKVSDTARQDMFDEVKRHFIQENGNLNGRTTKRSEVFQRYQRSVPKKDRLKGTWTLEQYERQYRQAMIKAVKEADPSWDFGKPFDSKLLDKVNREKIDNAIISDGVNLSTKTIDYSV